LAIYYDIYGLVVQQHCNVGIAPKTTTDTKHVEVDETLLNSTCVYRLY